jgi:hypothetical protein
LRWSFAAVGVDLPLDIGDERLTPRFHQSDERYHGHIGGDGQNDDVGASHL